MKIQLIPNPLISYIQRDIHTQIHRVFSLINVSNDDYYLYVPWALYEGDFGRWRVVVGEKLSDEINLEDRFWMIDVCKRLMYKWHLPEEDVWEMLRDYFLK